MGCLYFEIEGQSCLVGSVNQGLMKNRQIDLLDRMTQKRCRKNILVILSPTLPGIFQQITPRKGLQTFWRNYRLSIVIGLTNSCKKCSSNTYYSSMDEYLPHVFNRVFVHVRILVPCV